jgi:hypothetical protein
VFGRTGTVIALSGDYTTTLVTEGTNLYFTNARAIASTLTGYTSGAGTISATDTILSAIQKLNGNTAALVTGVSSVFGRTGTIVAISGDYTTTLVTEGTNLYYTQARFDTAFSGKSTTDLSEGINLYFTNSRAISSTLTGYVSGSGTISATDTILSAIQKLNGNISALVTGVSSVSGATNRITSTGGSSPIIDIASTYVGQGSITTLGTITTGIWNGTSINTTYTDAKIKGSIAATAGVIPFGTGTADTITTSAQLTYTPTPSGSTVANTANLANISTLPSANSAQAQWLGFYNGVTVPATPSSSSNYGGFYNDVKTSGGLSINALYAGINYMRVGSSATILKYRFVAGTGPNAATGMQSSSIGPSTTGVNFGAYNSAYGSATSNIGVVGVAPAVSGTGSGYGVMGIVNPVSGIGNAAGYFALSINDPTNDNAAIIADNGASSFPIFLGRVNAVIKMSIDAYGKIITLASTASSASINIPSGVAPTSPNAGDIYNLGTSIIIPSSGLSINSNLTPTSTLQVNGSFSRTYRLVTASTTLTNTDNIIEMTGSPFTVTLPDAISCTGREYIIKNTSGGGKTINTTSSQTIDGSLTVSITGKNWIVVISNGSNWIIIG